MWLLRALDHICPAVSTRPGLGGKGSCEGDWAAGEEGMAPLASPRQRSGGSEKQVTGELDREERSEGRKL